MFLIRFLRLQNSFSDLDRQIYKFRLLAEDLKNENRRYYGEYLSRILFDDAD